MLRITDDIATMHPARRRSLHPVRRLVALSTLAILGSGIASAALPAAAASSSVTAHASHLPKGHASVHSVWN